MSKFNNKFQLTTVSILLLSSMVLSGCGDDENSGASGDPSANTVDITPNSFSFTGVKDAATNAVVFSNNVRISGISDNVAINVSDAEYSIDGGEFTQASGTINNNQSVKLRITSAESFGSVKLAALTIGDLIREFSVTTKVASTTPDNFSFDELVDVALNSEITSSIITINGIDTPTPIKIVGGEYAIDDGEFTALAGMVNSGQTVRVNLQTTGLFDTTSIATLTIGDVSRDFRVTSVIEDTVPDSFNFIDEVDVKLDSQIISKEISLKGITLPTPISISGGMYSVNGEAFTNTRNTVNNGDLIRVRILSSTAFDTSTTATLDIGGIKGDFSVVTSSQPNLGRSYVIDESLGMILYNGDDFYLDSNIIIGSRTATINTNDEILVKGKAYNITYRGQRYKLYRTELPIINLDTNDISIPDEPKIGGALTLIEQGEENVESRIGIEVRGGVSQRYPKQSFSVELWEDVEGESTYKTQLLNLRKDDDWVLDGLWNEPNRVRDVVSHSLWLKFGRYPYSEEEPEITLGIEKRYVEVFINGSYRGVYYLGEKVDRKQLSLEKFDEENNELKGELYKGGLYDEGTWFIDSSRSNSRNSFDNNIEQWSGYEAKYPDEIGQFDWSNMSALVDFVMDSDQATFDASIEEKVYFENMADYYIFLNMIYAMDNRGKNLYTARYNQDTPYFFVPWDMDGSFGNNWRGEREAEADDMLTNGLFDKLILNDAFITEVKSRWNVLKAGALRVSEMQDMFAFHYDYLLSNGVYEREALGRDLTQQYNEQELNFINNWIENRYAFLDDFFDEL